MGHREAFEEYIRLNFLRGKKEGSKTIKLNCVTMIFMHGIIIIREFISRMRNEGRGSFSLARENSIYRSPRLTHEPTCKQ